MLLNLIVLWRLNLGFLLITSHAAKSITEAMTETKLPELFPTEEEWRKGEANPERPFETSKDRLVAIFRKNFAISPDTCVAGLKDLTPIEKRHMRKSWARNKEKVVLLDDEADKIYRILPGLVLSLKYKEERVTASKSKLKSTLEQFDKAIKLLKKHESDQLKMLKQIRYIQFLSGEMGPRTLMKNLLPRLILKYNNKTINMEEAEKLISLLPLEVAEIVLMEVQKKVGESIIADLQEAIFEQHLFHHDTYAFDYNTFIHDWWTVALSTVNFLDVHGFADPTTVDHFFQSIIQNPKTIKQLLLYVRYRYRQPTIDAFGSPNWTKHWTWKLLPRRCQELSNHEDLITKAHVLLDIRHDCMLKLIDGFGGGTELRRSFLHAFKTIDYSPFLESMGNAHSYQEFKHEEFKPDQLTEVFAVGQINLVAELLRIELTNENDLFLAYHLLHILDFFKGYIYTGDVNVSVRQDLQLDGLEAKLKLLTIGAKLEDLMSQGQSFLIWKFDHPSGASPDRIEFNETLKQAKDTRDQLLENLTNARLHNQFPKLAIILNERLEAVMSKNWKFSLKFTS